MTCDNTQSQGQGPGPGPGPGPGQGHVPLEVPVCNSCGIRFGQPHEPCTHGGFRPLCPFCIAGELENGVVSDVGPCICGTNVIL
mgnify:CR=1 FL=1